jgi:hypothetical protein
METMLEFSQGLSLISTPPQSSYSGYAIWICEGGEQFTFKSARSESGLANSSPAESAPQVTFSLPEGVVENPYSVGLLVLGQSGMERLYKFVNDYRDGWGDGTGRALSPAAYNALFIFLRHAPINVSSKPSIFMTPAGGLELAWDNADGRDIRVEFTSNNIEYYFSSTGSEGTTPLARVKEFAENFASLE